MENPNSKEESNGTASPTEQNPVNSDNDNNVTDQSNGDDKAVNRRPRTPFTELSQVDADHALARTLQQQERAFMMLRMNAGGGSYNGALGYGFEDETDDEEDDSDSDDVSEDDSDGSDEVDGETEDSSDANADDPKIGNEDQNSEIDPYSNEEYAIAVQIAEYLLGPRLTNGEDEDEEDEDDDEDEDEDEDEDNYEESIGPNSQDAWEFVDPDELSYEELTALGDIVGTESRGLSSDIIASLPSINYKSEVVQDQKRTADSCVVCMLDYEDGETLTVLSCKHSYHAECINNWLKINKVCPMCSSEVSALEKP